MGGVAAVPSRLLPVVPFNTHLKRHGNARGGAGRWRATGVRQGQRQHVGGEGGHRGGGAQAGAITNALPSITGIAGKQARQSAGIMGTRGKTLIADGMAYGEHYHLRYVVVNRFKNYTCLRDARALWG